MAFLHFTLILILISPLIAQESDEVSSDLPPVCSPCTCNDETGFVDCSDGKGENVTMANLVELNQTMTMLHVSFRNNKMKNIHAFPELPLLSLDFSHNQINFIEHGAFANLKSLSELDLSHNLLEARDLPPQVFRGHYDPLFYEPLKELKILNLAANKLNTLNPNIFQHLINFEDLDLSGNPLKQIDSSVELAIASVPTLRRINLANTQLEDLPMNLFKEPKGLRYLNLKGNLLDRIPKALLHTMDLDVLILDGNPIIEIGSKVSHFPMLAHFTQLSISKMPRLERILENAFKDMDFLAELNCTDNPKLNFIHSRAFPPYKEEVWLKKLNLRNNKLSILEESSIRKWDDLVAVDLSNNPWLCDCKTQWMIDNLLEKYGNVENVICEFPSEYRGMKMIELRNKTLDCVDFKVAPMSRNGNGLLGVMIGIFVVCSIIFMGISIYRGGCFGYVDKGPVIYRRADYYD